MDPSVLDQFESLGDNCEFGFVQRHYGREPLGLLRWAGSSAEGLTRALQARFTDLYRLEDLEPFTINLVRDVKYDIRLHTYLPINPAPDKLRFALRDDLLRAAHAKELQHVQYLVDKFLDALEDGDKIYVFKINDGVSLQQMRALHRALSSSRPQKLLVVVHATTEYPDSVVRLIENGLKVAGIYRLADYGHTEDAPFDAWRLVCETVATTPWDLSETPTSDFAVQPWRPAPTLSLDVVRHQVVEGFYRGLLSRRSDCGGAQGCCETLMSRGLEQGLDLMIRGGLESTEFREKQA